MTPALADASGSRLEGSLNAGVWRAIGAYAIWGMLPLYWKALHSVPALQLVGHRVVWSSVLLLAIVSLRRQAGELSRAAMRPKTLAVYSLAGCLLAANWLTYVWGVNAGHVVETSLGYFINPLLSVLLGVLVLGERLPAAQWAAIALAGAGVAYLAYDYGRPPWIAIVLASTFALYGLVKKTAPLGSVHGLTLETGALLLPSAALLAYFEAAGSGHLIGSSPLTLLGLVGTGVITTVPLLLFASAAKRIPMVWIGVLQYIAPTLQFLLGVFLFREAVSAHTLAGFSAVWAGLALFAVDALRRRRAAVPPVPE